MEMRGGDEGIFPWVCELIVDLEQVDRALS